MAKPRPITWPELLDFQSRIVGHRQAVRLGVSQTAVVRRTKSGAWQRLHRGTYATFTGVPPREAVLWAALLRAGPGAVLSYETAAEVHQLLDKPAAKIHITVPASHDPARRGPIRGVIIHRSRNVTSEPLPPWQLPRTPIAETVLDLIESAKTTDDAFAWLTKAIGRDLVNSGMLNAALVGRKRMRRRPWLAEALTDVADGVMSPIELRYVRDVERAHGLPQARRQARRELDSGARFLDNFYEAFKLCVEIDGRLTHPPEQKWRDADRDSDNLFRDDVQTIRLGLRHVTSSRCAQAARLATLFIRRGWDGAGLRPCSPDCAVKQVK
ncbi:MAG TPA: type IV toxin-antitoxin system AbiEi family antitoxin domain-containing protein [Trebonia sp.]|jgi:Transcriptional regulator, AbiEi antitoxin